MQYQAVFIAFSPIE